MRALRKRDKRAAKAVVRKHYQSLGQMLEVVSHRGPQAAELGRRSADPTAQSRSPARLEQATRCSGGQQVRVPCS